MKYTSDGTYEVLAGKIVIAKAYINLFGVYSVRILQGMHRTTTIEKICRDCPEFAKTNEIDKNYYPMLF